MPGLCRGHQPGPLDTASAAASAMARHAATPVPLADVSVSSAAPAAAQATAVWRGPQRIVGGGAATGCGGGPSAATIPTPSAPPAPCREQAAPGIRNHRGSREPPTGAGPNPEGTGARKSAPATAPQPLHRPSAGTNGRPQPGEASREFRGKPARPADAATTHRRRSAAQGRRQRPAQPAPYLSPTAGTPAAAGPQTRARAGERSTGTAGLAKESCHPGTPGPAGQGRAGTAWLSAERRAASSAGHL